jgi:class 3 adenylate cyclase/tetratricopeptide (TPR) repeat protein
MTACPSCGSTDHPAGSRFCFNCGAALGAPECVECGFELVAGARFCSNCGASQQPAPAPAPGPAAPVAARRVTSVLFGDLVGFTSLSETRDTEEVRELLSRYFEESRRIVSRYGGTVEKFIGDAVMAVWGVPTAHEDDAERAVRAGLELVDAVTVLGESEGVSGLAMRVGIVTGEVAVTIGASQQGMVAGDAVNTASRVQSVAEPGQVWVDETTRLLTTSAITYVDVGSHALKGKADPIPLWSVRAVVAAMGGAQRADGLEAPLVGRDRQLRLVKEVFHGVVDSHSPALLVVAGEPGVGKTRLAWEFEKYVDGLTQTTYWHSGRCLAYGEGVAFFALAEAFRVRLQVLAGAPGDVPDLEDDPARLIDRGLRGLKLPSEEREWLEPRVGALLGVGSVGAFPKEDLFAAWTTFLERVSSKDGLDTVALVIDDAQHADAGLLHFVEHLLAAAAFPCFVVLLARPGLIESHPSLATDRRATVVHLPELSDADMSALLSGLVAGLPDGVRTELVARSEGMPLFAVETVRSLIDRDMVVPRGGQYVLGDPTSLDLESIGAPASLQALVAARLDSLSADQRRVIDHASVLGMSFPRTSIEALCEGVADLDAVLSALLRLQLLSQESSRLSADFGHYRFVQSVVRQVAYSMLSRRDRKSLHLAVARRLEETEAASSELAPIVAQHYLDAVEAMPTDQDVGILKTAAIEQLKRAASRASSLGATGESAGHLQSALDLTEDPSDRAGISLDLALALLSAGRYQEAIVPAREATQTFDDLGDPVAAGRAVAAHAQALDRLGSLTEAMALAEPRLEALRDHPDAVSAQYALTTVIVRLRRALAHDVEDLAEVALSLALRMGDEEEICGSLASLAVVYFDRLPLVGRLMTEAAATRARDKHQPAALARALANLAAGQLEDDLAAAVAHAQEGREVALAIGEATWRAYCEANLLIALFGQGDWSRIEDELMGSETRADAALMSAWRAVEGSIAASRGEPWSPSWPEEETEGDLDTQAWRLHADAVAAWCAGDVARAARQALAGMECLFEYSQMSDDVPLQWQTAVEMALAADDDASLARLLEMARFDDDSDQSISVSLQAHRHRTRGLLALRDGDPVTAEQELRAAIVYYERWHSPLYQRRTEADLGLILVAQGRADEGQLLIEGARAFYAGIGATAWLADLDAKVVVAS